MLVLGIRERLCSMRITSGGSLSPNVDVSDYKVHAASR